MKKVIETKSLETIIEAVKKIKIEDGREAMERARDEAIRLIKILMEVK